MTIDREAAISAVQPGDTGEPGSTDTQAALIAWFAKRYDRPVTVAALRARLPEGEALDGLEAISRAFGAVGLSTRIVRRAPGAVDRSALPCVLRTRDGQPLILLAVSGKQATVIDPRDGGPGTALPLRTLARQVEPRLLLVTRGEAIERPSGHWFWGPVRAHKGIWAQILLAALCLNLLSLALPLFVMNVYDRVIPNVAFVTLWTLAIGVGIALVLDLLLRLIRSNLLERIGRRVDFAVASSLFSQAMRARLTDRPGGAAAIAGTIRDFETVREFFASASFVALIDLMFIGIFVAVLFAIVGPLALVPLLAVPVVLVLAMIAQAPIGRSAEQAQRMATRRHVVLVESLSGIETVKSVGAEPAMQREWEAAVAGAAQVSGRVRFWSGFATSSTMAVQQMVSVGIIIWGVFLVSQGQISIGGLIAANILAGRVLAPLGAIAQTIFRAQYAFRSLAALNRFMDLPVEQGAVVTHDLRVRAGKAAFREVRYGYPGARQPALDGLSFEAPPGQILCLLGKVGSGKSTTGRLLAGMLTPQSGTVLIDDVAVDQYEPAELRAGIGYLPQEPDLFTGTLRENLVLGYPGASDHDLLRALDMAAMDGFVAAHPDGLDLHLGERGERLSGGQRQGVALARLILRRPKMLFLDEPTNAMDQAMEARIVARLRELAAAGVGLIVSTHRQSLTAIADRLVVLDSGRAVLDGPRAEVMARLQAMASEQARG